MLNRTTKKLVFIGLAISLAGCSVLQISPVHYTSRDAQSTTVSYQPQQHEIRRLWERAETARSENDLRAAGQALSKALRMDPKDPVLWSRLAEVRYLQNSFLIAEQFAWRSIMLAESQQNPVLAYRNWLIISATRRVRGDTVGARDAQQQAHKLHQLALGEQAIPE